MTSAHLQEGPTLNREYNLLLVHWTNETGIQHTPECENCEADLTGKAVHEGLSSWVGDCCVEEHGPPEEFDPDCDCSEYFDYGDREDFHSDG